MAVNAADYVTPPVAGSVYQYASTTTHATRSVPDAWKNKYVTIFAYTADVHILFGTSDSLEVSTSSNPTNDTNNTFGQVLDTDNLAGYPMYVDEKYTHFSVESASAATLRVVVSSVTSTGVPYQPRSAVGGD